MSRNASITGLVLRGMRLEWTTLRAAKTALEHVAGGTADLVVDEAMKDKPEAVAAALKIASAGLRGPVSLGLASDQVLMRIMELPSTDPGELDSMVQLQIDKIAPFPEEKRVVSHEILETKAEASLVLIVACRRDAIEFAGSVCQRAGLDLQRIDLNAMAWWRLLKERGEILKEGRQLILAPDGASDLILVTQDGVPLAIRSLSSSADLTQVEYARELVQEISSLLMSLDLEHGAREVSRFDWWREAAPENEALQLLGAETETAVTVKAVSSLPGLSEGLARRSLSDFPGIESVHTVIDMVPREWRISASDRLLRRRLAATTVALLAAWLVGMGIFIGYFQWKKQSLARLDQTRVELQLQEDDVRQIRNRVTSFELQLDRNRSALECLREISEAMPEDVVFTSFQYKKGQNVIIKGESMNPGPIYDLKQALDNSKLFKKIDMASIQPVKRKESMVQVFQMVCNPPGAQP